MRRYEIIFLYSAVLLAGAPAAVFAQCASLDPALAPDRAKLVERVDRWGNVMFKKDEIRPAWYGTIKTSVDCAPTAAALADLDDCFEHFLDVQLGYANVHPADKCPQSVAVAAERAAAVPKTPAHANTERTAVASAKATAGALTAGVRASPAEVVASGFRDVAANPASGSAELARTLKQKAQGLVPAVPAAATAPEQSLSDKALDQIAGAWHGTVDAAKRLAALADSPAPDPLLGDRQRMLASYAGLGPLLKKISPDLLENYSRLIAQAAGAKDAASLQALDQPLKEIKNQALAGARASLEAGRLAAKDKGVEFDALAALKKSGAVSQGLSRTEAGRLSAERDPAMSSEQWDRYVYWQLPIEAELVLGTKFPIVSLDRKQGRALVLRGEDYGVDQNAKRAQAELDRSAKAAASAERAESDARAAAARGDGDVEAARKAAAERDAQAKRLADEAAAADRLAAKAAEDAAAADRESRAAAQEAQAKRATSAEEIRLALLKSGAGIDLEILFDYNSAKINEKARPQLAELGKALTELKDLEFVIYGHTDAKGGAAYNLGLSQRRAEAVKSYLVAPPFALPGEKLTALGFGAQRLAVPDRPYSEKNRRVQIAVKGAGDATAARSELEARAAEAQAQLEARSAELAQKSADAAQTAADAALAKQTAALASITAQKDARAAAAALTLAEKTRDALAAAVPTTATAKQEALAAVEEARPRAAAAAETAEGAVFVRDFRANHYTWFGQPEQLTQRIVETLTEGYRGHGDDGQTATRLFSRVNPDTNRTVAQDLAQDMERMEAQKGNFAVFRENVGDMFTLLQGRWIDVIGHVGRGPQFSISDLVPDTAATPPVKSTPVELISAAEFAKLSPQTSPSSGPSIDIRPTRPDPEQVETNDPAAVAADAAAAARVRQDADQAAAEALTRSATAAQAKLLADQAAAASAAATKAKGDALAAAAAARAQRASAAQIRDALTRSATSASIDLEVYFAFNSAQISAEAVPQLIELGTALSSPELKGLRLFIYGHTDAKGGAAYNLDLSQRRADAVRNYVIEHFRLEPSRLIAQGFGFQRLKVPDQPLSDKNRRVQVGVLR
jgi:outer membrane protein OmpA-like peptidoglycan-associated protein